MIAAGDRIGIPGRGRPVTRAFTTTHTGRNVVLITMTTQITGTRNGEDWPPVGATINLPDGEAADLIAAGYAEAAPQPAARKAKD